MMYQPFNIGKNFRIAAPGSAPFANKIDLVMQRGAFGSGEHETTESCLELMEDLPGLQDARILDLGSGTGILAIAALKLGASHAVCVDIEEKAVQTAMTNCSLNDLDDRVTHVIGTLADIADDQFDMVLANIYGDILLGIADPLSAAVKPGGRLLLSGILWEYNFDVRQAYEQKGSKVVRNRFLEEFSTILLSRQGNP